MNNKNSKNKIAFCISGYPNKRILDHILHLTKYKNMCDFFVFFWDVIDIKTKNKINDLLYPIDIEYEKPIQFPFDAKYKEPDKCGHKNDALSMFYGISKVQMMRKLHEEKIGKKYDLVFRIRYDVHLITDLRQIINDVYKFAQPNTIIFPFERHHIGICDQLWCGSSISMDYFTNLFEWIHLNIETLFFVNENILYKFLMAFNMKIKCADIKYVLRREHLINAKQNMILQDYNQQLSLPWNVGCPEHIDGKYQQYIDDKNNSANNIYFLSNNMYFDIICKLSNNEKYLNVTDKNSELHCSSNDVGTNFNIHSNNSYLINIIISNSQITKNRLSCLSIVNDSVYVSSDTEKSECKFFLIRKNNLYQFFIYVYENPKTQNTLLRKYLSMNKNGIVYSSYDSNNPDTFWKLV